MSKQDLQEKLRLLPNEPGIYKYFNDLGEILYVGKAKNIKKRVASYFNKDTSLNRKTKNLVRQIHDIQYTTVENETDALLLENNLIKQLKPKYNILLKDGKSYPFICVLDERFPRIISTRNKNHKGIYYGPYPNVQTVNTLIEMLHNIYPLRTCNFDLSETNITNGKFKACLEFQIGNCNAPCIDNETEENYTHYIEASRNILEGKLHSTKQYLKKEMEFFAANYEFEKAEMIKRKLLSLDNYQSRSTIISTTIKSLSAITIKTVNGISALNHLEILNGMIVSTKTLEAKVKLEESEEDIINRYILTLENAAFEKTFITNIQLPTLEDLIKVEYPQRGEKHKLIQLSIKNCLTFIKEKEQQSQARNRKSSGLTILEQAKKDLSLHEIPVHIECFDNSNIQGTNPVASMVCFKNSIPSKKDYRHYNIKTVIGPDDFSSMKEVVYRRYKRLLEEKQPLPQLVVIDGGKGQLSSAMESITELGLKGKIVVISIAKKLEEIYYPGDEFPIYISKKSTTLKLIQRLRDEAHRFAITFHRNQRSKRVLSLEMENIPGIGEKTIQSLLSKYKSFANIAKTPVNELESMIGKSKTQKLLEYLNSNS